MDGTTRVAETGVATVPDTNYHRRRGRLQRRRQGRHPVARRDARRGLGLAHVRPRRGCRRPGSPPCRTRDTGSCGDGRRGCRPRRVGSCVGGCHESISLSGALMSPCLRWVTTLGMAILMLGALASPAVAQGGGSLPAYGEPTIISSPGRQAVQRRTSPATAFPTSPWYPAGTPRRARSRSTRGWGTGRSVRDWRRRREAKADTPISVTSTGTARRTSRSWKDRTRQLSSRPPTRQRERDVRHLPGRRNDAV